MGWLKFGDSLLVIKGVVTRVGKIVSCEVLT